MKKVCSTYYGLESKLDELKWIAPLLIRLCLGIIFIAAGWGKFSQLDQVAGFFANMGIPMAGVMAPFVAVVEFVGGLMILNGCLTRLVSIPLIVIMIVAIMTAHSGDVTSFLALLKLNLTGIILLFVSLVFTGPGKVSLDHYCKKK